MDVIVVAFGVMREYLADPRSNKQSVSVPEGARVADLLDRLGVPQRLIHVALVDERRTGLEEVLHEGAEVTLMPPFSGGAIVVRSRDA
jgi:sulfur carrier protein ThiS